MFFVYLSKNTEMFCDDLSKNTQFFGILVENEIVGS